MPDFVDPEADVRVHITSVDYVAEIGAANTSMSKTGQRKIIEGGVHTKYKPKASPRYEQGTLHPKSASRLFLNPTTSTT